MPARNINNCFGDGSPSWNVKFPAGNLTAAEIIAYFPHWLKSVDVIDRFIRNGGGAVSIVTMVNEFRNLPGNIDMQRNSILIMMQNAMRYAGLKEWKAGKHSNFVDMATWNSYDLRVHDFRVPRITHPKTGNAVAFNAPAPAIEFRDLALHVKKHPSGPDALDLTRCIAWACSHPQQSWLFPDDFGELVNLLGGASDVIPANSDSETFTRRSDSQVTPLATSAPTHRRRTAPAQAASRRSNKNSVRNARSKTQSSPQLRSSPQKRSQQPVVPPRATYVQTVQNVKNDNIYTLASPPIMRLTRSRVAASSAIPVATFTDEFPHTPQTSAGTFDGGVRKSSRLRKNTNEINPDIPEAGDLDGLTDDHSDEEYTTSTKRKRCDEDVYTPDPQDEADSSEEDARNSELSASASPASHPRGRPAAKKARHEIKALADAENTPLFRIKTPRPSNIDPALTSAARDFSMRVPIYVKPPNLHPDRLTVDGHNVWAFAEIGALNPWASALSSTRFNNGPRRTAPFRELYRLTQPAMEDASDWAENIRWAKEQYLTFGSKTWTEYDYHLEMVTDHRRAMHWVSEEAIQFAAF